MNQQMCLMIGLSLLALILVSYCLRKSSFAAEGIAFPFGPINPKDVSPFNAQSIFGQPSYMFQLASNPQNAPYGAYQTLQAKQAQANFTDNVLPVDWKTNQGFNNSGNASFALELSDPPFYQWSYL